MRPWAASIPRGIAVSYTHLGPCIAKKQEADEAPAVDACLTFDELTAWMNDQGVAFYQGEEQEEEGKRSRFYPTPGGILKSMDRPQGYRWVAIDGVENLSLIHI